MKLESLGNIAQIIAGQSPPSSEYNKNGDGVPFFQGKADFGHTNPVARSWTTKTTKLSVPDDILISVRAPVGSVNINNIDACIGRGLSAIRVNKNISRDYVYQYLKVNQKRISKMGVGSTFTAINQKDLASIKIPIPENLSDQIRIAEVLTKVETLVQQRKESIELLDNFLRSTFLDMFGDPVKNEKKWEKTAVGKYTDCIVPGRDKPKSFTGTIPWIRTEDLNNKSFCNASKEKIGLTIEEINQVKGKIIPANSVIMTCVGQLNVISINTIECIINQQLHSFQCHEELNNIFLMFTLGFEERFMFANASTTTVAYMNKSICNSIPIIVPPIKLQNKFASTVEKAEKIKQHYELSLKELENLFGSLSQKAFKGELDLSKLDVSAQIREIEKKIEAEIGLDISLETKLTKSMQQIIEQTEKLQKALNPVPNILSKSLEKQIEAINKISAPFQNLKAYQIPEQLTLAMKAFDGIKSITSQLSQEAKEKYTRKLIWEEVNFEMVANWIKDEYSEYHFNSEILMNFLENERVTFSNYHSSEELKTNPKINEADDIKSFVFSALKAKNQFIKLEQFFYDAVSENVQLKLRSDDYEVIKNKEKELRSGIYFKVVE